ncbi:SMI1/KNR4 family protein [Streptomyces griseoaurantiacus]|uniref:SMI1/KNR4 family protein n=1 Tax=Streptomyces griseoaurantiacus TaxID=68213 RepID=UPI002E2E6FCC|nr:SMI1/KNR4 family protein [Streptomyces jietaisiensis]
MDIDIPSDVHDAAARLGAGVPYALKVVAAQLTGDPDMGRPSSRPGVRTVTVDGELFEDCPALAVDYVHEAERIEIRSVNLASSAEPALLAQRQELVFERKSEQPAGPAADAIAERQVADAWQRIETWLRRHAPATVEILRPGASEEEIADFQQILDVRIPAELKALWRHCAGVSAETDNDVSFMLGNRALMRFEGIDWVYRQYMESQQRIGNDEFPIWRPAWIPFCSYGASDYASGLLMDAETGKIWYWDRYGERTPEFESLTVYLEEMADLLETPALSDGTKPGLLHGGLVWGPPVNADQAAQWAEFTG